MDLGIDLNPYRDQALNAAFSSGSVVSAKFWIDLGADPRVAFRESIIPDLCHDIDNLDMIQFMFGLDLDIPGRVIRYAIRVTEYRDSGCLEVRQYLEYVLKSCTT